MNTDGKTVFMHDPTAEATLPFLYFDTLAEAEQAAWQMHQADSSLEMVLYAGDNYLQMIPPDQ